MADRRTARIFTFDRALLLGAITIGGMLATRELKVGDLEKRLAAQELQTFNIETEQTQLKIDRAVIDARLRDVQQELARLRETIERKIP